MNPTCRRRKGRRDACHCEFSGRGGRRMLLRGAPLQACALRGRRTRLQPIGFHRPLHLGRSYKSTDTHIFSAFPAKHASQNITIQQKRRKKTKEHASARFNPHSPAFRATSFPGSLMVFSCATCFRMDIGKGCCCLFFF